MLTIRHGIVRRHPFVRRSERLRVWKNTILGAGIRETSNRVQCVLSCWCCSVQYEYEAVEFRASARPSWSRWQGADTVPHVVLWWHGSCLGKLRYPQKARQHWHWHWHFTIRRHSIMYNLYIDIAMQHARTHARHIIHTYIHITNTHEHSHIHIGNLLHDLYSSGYLLIESVQSKKKKKVPWQ